MKVVYTVAMDGEGQIRAAIPPPAEGAVAPSVTHKVQTRSVDVRMCQTTAIDEVLSTLEIFNRARKGTGMSWADAGYNFLN